MSATDWLERRILITVGTGGVGKTTVGAALGLAAARRGKRALVLTIDPARRLADALGVGELGNEARDIPRARLRAAGVRGEGSLAAMMLDTKRTFDELLEQYITEDEARERILDNPIYRNLTDALAGSREYSAMEKLYQIHSEGKYDLIVLDTPPAAHALDFLDAPRGLTGFLDSQILRLLFRPALAMGRTGFRLFRFGSNMVLPVIERVTGMEFLTVVSEFLLAFESLWDGIATRAREIDRVLHDPACGFVLVVGPDPVQTRRAEEFWARLDRERIHLVGLVLNRVRAWPGGGAPPTFAPDDLASARAVLERALGGERWAATAEGIVDAVERWAALARRDRALREHLAEVMPLDADDVREVPLFPEDVHALDALGRMSDHLFAASGRGGSGAGG